MTQIPSPNDEYFSRKEAARPLREAVEALAADTGRSLEELEQMKLGQIAALAQEHHGADLPDFWEIWIDWNRDEGPQPMGDL